MAAEITGPAASSLGIRFGWKRLKAVGLCFILVEERKRLDVEEEKAAGPEASRTAATSEIGLDKAVALGGRSGRRASGLPPWLSPPSTTLIEAKACWEPSLLSGVHMSIYSKRKQHLLVCLLVEFTQQSLSLKTTTKDATWNLTIVLKSRNSKFSFTVGQRNACKMEYQLVLLLLAIVCCTFDDFNAQDILKTTAFYIHVN